MSDNEEEKNKENNEENEESKSEISPEDMKKYHEFFIKKNKLYVLIIKDENLEDIIQIPIEFKYLNKILNMAEIEMKNETDYIYFTDKVEEVAEGEEKKEIKTVNSLKKNLESDFNNNKNENETNINNEDNNNEIDNKEINNNENEANNENDSFGLNFDNNNENENEINTNTNNNEIEINKENNNNDNISEEKEEKTPKEENNNNKKDENFINILYPEKRKSFLTYQTKDEYKKLLNTNQYYFVMLPEYSTLDEEEKIPFEIRVSKKSFERIFQLNDTNILELISYIEICIIQIDYQVLLNIYNKKNKFEKKFINLINFLKEYYILFNNNNNQNSPVKNLFVSAFSLKKIMTLGGYIDLDIFDFGKIVVMKNLNTEEIKNRRNKIEKEFNYANIRSIRESIMKAEANKNKKFYIGNDIAFKGIKLNLNEMKICYENINEILMNEDLRKKNKEEKLKNQESLINTNENNNNNLNNNYNNDSINENDKEMILSAKENLLSILNDVENNTLYLYDDNVLISSSFYYQLTDEDLSLTIEDVYLPNYFDNNTLTLIQQSKLKNNKLNNTNEFIVINDGIKTYIVNKQSFLSNLVENDYNNKINVYNLYTKSNEIVDILNVKIIEIPIEDINNYTHADTLNSIENNNNNNNNNNSIEKINTKLKNLLKNSLILIEIKNKLIPKKIIDDINNDTTNKKEFEVISVDKDLKPSDHLKLTKEECSNILQYPSYVEITLDEPEIKETKKLFLKKKSLDVGFNNNEIDIITNDNNNNNYTFKKKNIIKISHNNIIDYNQFKVDIQMKDIIFNLNNEIKNGKIYYVIFDNDNNKKLIRKEYFSLIKNYNTVIPFENFNVLDDNNNEVIINKNKIPNNFIEYVEVTNNFYKPGKILYINVNDIKKEHLEMINEDYDFEEFYNEQPVKMKLKDIIIIKNTSPITELPIQKEEENKRDLIEKKNLINEENENRDFIKIYDINETPQFILKKYLLDTYNKITTYSKNPLLNKKFQLNSNFNIRNLYGDIITVNTDEIIDNNNNKENLITYIIIIDKSNGNKKYLVDKEKLKREINKVNNNNNEINIFDNNTDNNVKIKIKDFKLGNLIPEKLPPQNLLQIKESFMLNESDYESDSSSINNDEEKKLKKKNDRKIYKIRKCVIRRFLDDDEEVN